MMRSAHKKELKLVLSLLAVFFLASVVVIFNTENSFGGGDPFSHFKMAYWGWKYPRLLFDSWGKPAYTILVSPFAQLGMNFARMYNVLMGLLTAFFSWKLARELKLNNAWMVVLLVLFTPIYFSLMFAALTEVTFSMLLILSLLLFFQRKYFWSAVVISFLPLVRTEGVVLFPIFLLAFSLKKQWKALPFFTVGFFLISWLGRPFYHSFWWLITDMPYKGGAADIYGHGNLFHFIDQTGGILGYPIAGLFCVGLVAGLWFWIRKDRFQMNQRFYFLLLIPGSYLLFLAAHSFVWWKGIGNSLGLIRVIGAVTPLAAIMALSGFDVLADVFSKYRKTIVAVSALLLLWIIYAGATTHRDGFEMSKPQQILTRACNYLKQNDLDKYKIYYFSSYIPYRLGIDPYDNQHSSEGIPHTQKISNAIPEGSIIVWDAHFGPNEGRTPLDKLLGDNGLRLLNVFKPKVPFKVLGGYDYAVYIFQKGKADRGGILNMVLGFENKQDDKGKFYIRKYAHSGHYSLKMDSLLQFSPVFSISFKDLTQNNYSRIQASVWVYPVYKLSETPCSLVVTFQHGNVAYKYHAYDLNNPVNSRKLKLNQWNKITVDYLIPEVRQKSGKMEVYIWNRGKKDIFFDDLKVELFNPDK